jgi:hypothetical protein
LEADANYFPHSPAAAEKSNFPKKVAKPRGILVRHPSLLIDAIAGLLVSHFYSFTILLDVLVPAAGGAV